MLMQGFRARRHTRCIICISKFALALLLGDLSITCLHYITALQFAQIKKSFEVLKCALSTLIMNYARIAHARIAWGKKKKKKRDRYPRIWSRLKCKFKIPTTSEKNILSARHNDEHEYFSVYTFLYGDVRGRTWSLRVSQPCFLAVR